MVRIFFGPSNYRLKWGLLGSIFLIAFSIYVVISGEFTTGLIIFGVGLLIFIVNYSILKRRGRKQRKKKR